MPPIPRPLAYVPAVAAVLVMVVGCSSGGGDASAPTSTAPPATSAAATPSVAATSAAPDTSAEDLRIPADLPPEELVRAANDLWIAWSVAGATDDSIAATKDAWYGFDGEYTDFLDQMATENAELYATALLPDDRTSNQNTAYVYDKLLAENKEFLEIGLKRYPDQPLIERSSEISDVQEFDHPDEGERIITFELVEKYENSDYGDKAATVTYSFNISDGTARLFGVNYDDHPEGELYGS